MGEYAFRANKANDHAGQWHQGSNVITGQLAAVAEHHEDMAERDPNRAAQHMEAARAWSKAAVEDAKVTRANKGMASQRQWVKSPAWKAVQEAKRTSRGLVKGDPVLEGTWKHDLPRNYNRNPTK